MSVQRTFERLAELYAIGGGPGANRPHPSAEENAAHELTAGWLREAGLAVDVDAHGNLLGRSGSRDDVRVGSHLDTVPHGGKFDGAGRRCRDRGGRAGGCGAVVAFRGEEVGCIGSRALCRYEEVPSAFLELHIEQGPTLERAGVPLGIVNGIVGMRAASSGSMVVRVMLERPRCRPRGRTRPGRDGDPQHQGRRPRGGGRSGHRRRAGCRAGAGNVIPGRVRLSVDVRAPDSERLDAVLARVGLEPGHRAEPVAMRALPCRSQRRDRGPQPSSRRATVGRRSRRGHPRRSRRRPGCCSSAASTAASAIRRTSSRPRRTSRSGSTCSRRASPARRLARLAVVVVEVLQACDEAQAAEVDLVRARVVADVARLARAVGEEGHAVLGLRGDLGRCRFRAAAR